MSAKQQSLLNVQNNLANVIKNIESNLFTRIERLENNVINEKNNENESNIVNIPDYGKIKGYLDTSMQGTNNVYAFLGVPYTNPPVGENRFRPPTQLNKLNENEILNATNIDNNRQFVCCPQENIYNLDGLSEDCLYMDIFSSNPVKNWNSDYLAPVLVFIHGGAVSFGSKSINFGNGLYEINNQNSYKSPMLSEQNIVYVSINYRLNIFSFRSSTYLSTESTPNIDPFIKKYEYSTSSLALLDILVALNYIKKNIHLFGGDPNNITVSGESAGAFIINNLTCIPEFDSLCNNIILQSGSYTSYHPFITLNSNLVPSLISDENNFTEPNIGIISYEREILEYYKKLNIDISTKDGIDYLRGLDDIALYNTISNFEEPFKIPFDNNLVIKSVLSSIWKGDISISNKNILSLSCDEEYNLYTIIDPTLLDKSHEISIKNLKKTLPANIYDEINSLYPLPSTLDKPNNRPYLISDGWIISIFLTSIGYSINNNSYNSILLQQIPSIDPITGGVIHGQDLAYLFNYNLLYAKSIQPLPPYYAKLGKIMRNYFYNFMTVNSSNKGLLNIQSDSDLESVFIGDLQTKKSKTPNEDNLQENPTTAFIGFGEYSQLKQYNINTLPDNSNVSNLPDILGKSCIFRENSTIKFSNGNKLIYEGKEITQKNRFLRLFEIYIYLLNNTNNTIPLMKNW